MWILGQTLGIKPGIYILKVKPNCMARSELSSCSLSKNPKSFAAKSLEGEQGGEQTWTVSIPYSGDEIPP